MLQYKPECDHHPSWFDRQLKYINDLRNCQLSFSNLQFVERHCFINFLLRMLKLDSFPLQTSDLYCNNQFRPLQLFYKTDNMRSGSNQIFYIALITGICILENCFSNWYVNVVSACCQDSGHSILGLFPIQMPSFSAKKQRAENSNSPTRWYTSDDNSRRKQSIVSDQQQVIFSLAQILSHLAMLCDTCRTLLSYKWHAT